MAKIALALGFGILGAFTGGLGWFGFAATAGNALLGFSLGMAAGQILGNVIMPTHLPNQVGPRLSDLTVSGAANGAPIPIGYGVFRFAGQIIWSPGLQEISKTTKQSSKGAPSYKSTTYTYQASLAVAFGESYGTSPSTRFGDVLKIWFDTKVVFDTTGGDVWQASHVYQVGQSITDQNGNLQTITLIQQDARSGLVRPSFASSNNATTQDNNVTWVCTHPAPTTTQYPTPVIYNGTETQLPDPTIQANEGVNRTPAFRGLIYVVWENMPLADFGNRIPNLQALVKFGQ